MIKIYYFSGTGNTFWSAKKIAEIIGGGTELVNIGAEAEKDEIIMEADAVVLLFPAYAYGPPLIVRRFLKRAVIKTPYFAAFVTYGTSPGGALASICRTVRRKEIKAFYFGRIAAVENYIAIFGPQKPEITEKRLKLQSEATVKAARCVIERKSNAINTFRPLSVFVWLLFSIAVKVFYKCYKVNGNCDGCGDCVKLCPVSAITLKNGRPEFSKKCEHCQGCLNWCPKQAISFGRVRPGTPRYHHPEIDYHDRD